MLETTERLITNEIANYAAIHTAFGGMFTIDQADQLTEELTKRVRRVFADVKQQADNSSTASAVSRYHSHIVKTLIDCGVVIHPQQISLLQIELNKYISQQFTAGAK